MQAEIAERIKDLRKRAGLTQQEVANYFSTSRSTVSAWEKGVTALPIEALKQYATLFATDVRNLLYAPNEMPDDAPQPPQLRVLAVTTGTDGKENIELVPVKAAAGYLQGYGDPEFVRELPRFRLPFLHGGTHRAFEIKGDSMLPIPSGSVVIGRYVEDFLDLRKGEAYIFVTRTEGIVFKRLADLNNSRLLLSSDNPLYPAFDIPLGDIVEVWKSRMWMNYVFERN